MHDLITFALGSAFGFTSTVGALYYRLLAAQQDATRKAGRQ